MTDPNSPSTSYKGSLELDPVPRPPNDEDQELTFVNPCYAAPTPFTELQPFSSRQSKTEQPHLGGDGHTWPTIHEDGDEKVDRDDHHSVEQGIEGDRGRTMSKTKMFLTAAGMCLTYFLGVSLSPGSNRPVAEDTYADYIDRIIGICDPDDSRYRTKS
jgi:hypothetical protein